MPITLIQNAQSAQAELRYDEWIYEVGGVVILRERFFVRPNIVDTIHYTSLSDQAKERLQQQIDNL